MSESKGPEIKNNPFDFSVNLNEHSKVGKVYGIVSGKGGVGKSLVTGLSAIATSRLGKSTAILDADITGPSIPKMFGVQQKTTATELGIMPRVTRGGIKVMSANLVLDDPDSPVVWRSPVITNAVKQFWSDVYWGDIDVMFIDMPPGTGDVPLTVFQSLPVDGIIVITSPQDLVSMIVNKALGMAELMKIPVLGVIENMSYATCPDCGRKIEVFGESHIEEIFSKHDVPMLGRIPIDPELAKKCDAGDLESVNAEWLDSVSESLKDVLK